MTVFMKARTLLAQASCRCLESVEGGFFSKLHDAVAVGAVGELEIEDLGVVFGLLEAVGGIPVFGLGLDHREREVLL